MTDTTKTAPRASSLYQWFLCPGSRRMQEGLPDIKSEYAESGTRIHKAWEIGDLSACSDEEREEVRELMELTRKHRSELEEETNLAANVFREFPLSLDANGYTITGHPDVFMISGTEGRIIDAKTGWGGVEEDAASFQGGVYCAMVMECFPEIDHIDCYFYESKTGRVTLVTLNRKDLPHTKGAIWQIIRNTEQASMVLRASQSACKFCRATACPARMDDNGVAQMTPRSVAEIPSRKLNQIYEQAKVVEKAIKAVKDEMRTRAGQGDPDIDYILKETKGNRKITNLQRVWQVLD